MLSTQSHHEVRSYRTFTRPQYSITTPEGIGAAKLAATEAKLATTRLERERKLALMQSKR